MGKFVDLTKLFSDEETVLFVADDQRSSRFNTGQAVDSLLQHRVLSVQADELFWIQFT